MIRLVIAAAAAALLLPAAAGAAPASTAQGVYTAAQGEQGKALYLQHCATACHQPGLTGSGPAPDLAGSDFMARWEGLSLGDLAKKITTTMPLNRAGTLTADQYLAVIAYIIARNDFPAGPDALRGDQLADIVIGR